jgi:hypothetical protein
MSVPAHTLTGIVSGGGNQINNVVIGAVTPLVGSFTVITANTAAAGTNTTQVATTAFVQSALGNTLGTGQTYQVLTGSRVAGTTYTNSTNKPIFVSIGFTGNFAAGKLNIGGVVAAEGQAAQSTITQLSGIVPVGLTYSFSGAGTIVSWSELR